MKQTILCSLLGTILLAGSAAAEPGPAAPRPSQSGASTTEDPRDAVIRELRERIEQLERRVAELEGRAAPPPAAPSPPPTAPAIRQPLLSGLADVLLRGGDSGGTPRRGRFSLRELELAIQDAVAPGMNVEAFLSAEQEEDWDLVLEEGVLNLERFLLRRVSARLGRTRTPFGRQNVLHPHALPTVDFPAAIRALLGEEGLFSDGGFLTYRIPVRVGMFASATLGFADTTSEAEEGTGFAATGQALGGRLFASRDLGGEREIELGLSHYRGRGSAFGAPGRRRLAVSGLDLTFRAYPGPGQRWFFQSELLRHSTGGPGGEDRWGYYVLGERRWSPYWAAGVRWDDTQFPWPSDERERAINLWITRFINEQTAIRLQLRHGRRPGDSGLNEIFLQFLAGFGPHVHTLQQ